MSMMLFCKLQNAVHDLSAGLLLDSEMTGKQKHVGGTGSPAYRTLLSSPPS